MRMLDASSIIYAWDNYPLDQFPALWVWLASQLSQKLLTIARCAFDEVKTKTPECGDWLSANAVEIVDISNAVLSEAMRIKKLVGIVAENYHPKGVGANDITIIATARINGASLVSNEGVQTTAPLEPSKRKIPAVCAMTGIGVECLSFLSYIKQSKATFK
jgi:Domain of unknown function (DUF4411)